MHAPATIEVPSIFQCAARLWHDLRRYHGLAIGSGCRAFADSQNWSCYDHSALPSFSVRASSFERVVCDGYLDPMPIAKHMAFMHAMVLMLEPVGQILLSTTDPKGFMARCCDRRLSYPKRIRPHILQ
jgi:hypothetical protein